MTYRVGGHWKTTIVRVGVADPDAGGRRADDEFVAVVVNLDRDLAEVIATALNRADADELLRLRRLVGEEGQEGWGGCSRAEAIRQANYFHDELMRALDDVETLRERLASVIAALSVLEARAAEIDAKASTPADRGVAAAYRMAARIVRGEVR